MTKVDYLIVGSGLTGAVIARSLVDAGKDVLVVDRRNHMGGNVHDTVHESGVRIHTYGPHYFRTSSKKIWDFATRFAKFYTYEAALLSNVDNELVQWPIANSYITRKVGIDWTPEFKGKPSNLEEAALGLMPRLIYEKFIKEYNEKQWGVPVKDLSAELCSRFDVRYDDEPRLKPNALYQGIPEDGYASWMAAMLNGVKVELGFDYLKNRNEIVARKCLIFTGPIDEFFDYECGKLLYRGQVRKHTYMPLVDFVQPCGQINNPLHSGGTHIRTLEWKHMMPKHVQPQIKGTVVTQEIPFTPVTATNYEYPFPDNVNKHLYETYRTKADGLTNTLICGRLGEYKYYDMDQAIGRALTLSEKLV